MNERQRAVIKQALEVLEKRPCSTRYEQDCSECNAIESLRQLLEQPAPVLKGWKMVPVEPTREMWTAVNKLDDQCAAGNYNGKGCSIEQAWNCLLDAAPTPPAQQAVPLTPEQREEIAKGWRGRNWTVGDVIDAVEAAHSITAAPTQGVLK
jgi:hypothetical protein